MCGIAGQFTTTQEVGAAQRDVELMISSLEHRGPDDRGVAEGPGWAVGMTRLAILDLTSAGHQPMTRGPLTGVFNGEVYNYRELRRELVDAGYEFESNSDTEVVIQAFRHWGTDALRRFNGMFAVAIVDSERRKAWLARDRFGKKPLFVFAGPGRVAFASELKAMLPVVGGELRLNQSALAAYFRFQYVPAPQCIFEKVRKLEPGCWVEVDLESQKLSEPTAFWALPIGDRQGEVGPQEVLERVRESVRRRLVADVPVGALLSGGTDSSLVVSCMRDAAADVRTFSIGFDDARFDESRYARRVAERLETRHTHHQLTHHDALALIPRLAYAYDEPFADSSAIPTMAVADLARRDVTVALSGDGGDELFGGYERYRLARFVQIAERIPSSAARAVAKRQHSSRLARRLGLLASLAAAGSEALAYQELVSVWKRPQLSRLMPDVTAPDPVARAFADGGRSTLERMMRADSRTYLVDDILQKVDRASMAFSLEARNPLLDPDVVDVALSAVRQAERAPGRKPLLRAALKLQLPAELVDRPKMGFGVPIGDWLRTDLRSLVEDLVLSRNDGEYDTRVAHDLCRSHLEYEIDATPQLWSLLTFELWRDRWLPRT